MITFNASQRTKKSLDTPVSERNGCLLPILLNNLFGAKFYFFNGLVDMGMAPKLASALWAFTYMFICFIPAYILYKKKIFIKV